MTNTNQQKPTEQKPTLRQMMKETREELLARLAREAKADPKKRDPFARFDR